MRLYLLPIMFLLLASVSYALACGDYLTDGNTTVLTSDLGDCTTSSGLNINGSNIILDCAGYSITATASVAIKFSSVIGFITMNNITIKNCFLSASWGPGLYVPTHGDIINELFFINSSFQGDYGVYVLSGATLSNANFTNITFSQKVGAPNNLRAIVSAGGLITFKQLKEIRIIGTNSPGADYFIYNINLATAYVDNITFIDANTAIFIDLTAGANISNIVLVNSTWTSEFIRVLAATSLTNIIGEVNYSAFTCYGNEIILNRYMQVNITNASYWPVFNASFNISNSSNFNYVENNYTNLSGLSQVFTIPVGRTDTATCSVVNESPFYLNASKAVLGANSTTKDYTNSSDLALIVLGLGEGGGGLPPMPTSINIISPANSTYLNSTLDLDFMVWGNKTAYPCWQTLDGTETYLGSVSNYTHYTDILSELSIGGHTINITCQNENTNTSAITTFAEIIMQEIGNTYKTAINETERAFFNSTFQFNTLITAPYASLWYNNSLYSTTRTSFINHLATYNRSLETPLILSNNSNITLVWQLLITYSNGTNQILNSTSVKQSLYFAYFFSNFTLNSTDLLEGDILGANTSIISFVNNAQINATVFLHTAYKESGNTTYPFYTAALVVPVITLPSQTFGAFVNLTFSYGGFSRNYTSANQTLTITAFNLSNCTAGTIALTYYLKDEITYELLNGSFEKSFTFSKGSVNKNYSHKWNNTYIARICITPAWASLKADSIEQHEFHNGSIIYSPRSYFLVNATINNITNTIDQFLLNSTYAKLTQFTVLGSTNQPLSGIVIQVLRYRIYNNSLELIAMGKTAADGTTSIYLQPIDVFYKFILINPTGRIIYSTDATQTISCDPATALCQKTFIVNDLNTAEFWNYYGSIAFSCTFSNATGWYYCDYADTAGLAYACTLQTYRIGPFGPIQNCTNSLTSAAGTLGCNLGNTTGNRYVATLWCEYSSTKYVMWEETLDFTTSAQFGNFGQFLAFFLVIFIPATGLFNPAIAVLLGFVALAGSAILGLYDVGLGALVGLGVATLVIMYRLKT